MASQDDDHHIATVFPEDLDEDDDSDDEPPITLTTNNPNNNIEEEDDVDLIDDDDDDSTSSGVGEVTIAVPGLPTATETLTTSTPPPPTITTTTTHVADVITPVSDVTTPIARSSDVVVLEHQKKSMPSDESRRLFQRLWTDEDEIELLQGFLDYTNQVNFNNSFHNHHHHGHGHHDTTAFYDQIKDRLQLDFNKNQLVEKLRRLKKKYRNVISKINSGKEYVFKTPHDQITFDISCKIWSSEAAIVSTPASADVVAVARFDDEEQNPYPNPNPNLNLSFNLNEHNGNGNSAYQNSTEKKTPRSRKRSRSGGVKTEEKTGQFQQAPVPPPPAVVTGVGGSNSVPNLVEETVKSCLLPLFKELVDGVRGGGSRGLMNLDPFGGSMNFGFGDVTDEKWRKQHILELEVCSKRLELVQDQIKSQLEELRSMRR